MEDPEWGEPSPKPKRSEWTPKAYISIIEVDLAMLYEAVENALSAIEHGNDARYQASEIIRFAGKIGDNAVLLRQRLNR